MPANESTTSLAYTDLATVGPTITVTVPSTGRLLVSVTSAMLGNSGSTACFVSFAGTGANIIVALDADALMQAGGAQQRASAETVLSGLTPGTEVLTAKYKVTGGGAANCAYANRSMFAIPLP